MSQKYFGYRRPPGLQISIKYTYMQTMRKTLINSKPHRRGVWQYANFMQVSGRIAIRPYGKIGTISKVSMRSVVPGCEESI